MPNEAPPTPPNSPSKPDEHQSRPLPAKYGKLEIDTEALQAQQEDSYSPSSIVAVLGDINDRTPVSDTSPSPSACLYRFFKAEVDGDSRRIIYHETGSKAEVHEDLDSEAFATLKQSMLARMMLGMPEGQALCQQYLAMCESLDQAFLARVPSSPSKS